MTSWHHAERLQAVQDVVRDSGACRVVDLGCGDGDMFVRLATSPDLVELVGLDICTLSLERLRNRLAKIDVLVPRINVRAASMTDPAPDLAGFDCAILVETIEHIDPDRLSQLERALFRVMRPGTVVITTPNAEFNSLLGVPAHRMRHPDHRFEWDRARFRRWCRRAADHANYETRFHDIAGQHPALGGASQMAVFTRTDLDGRPPDGRDETKAKIDIG
ncbi:methyltransferase domain-containing protein [Yoonia sp.]|uniref:methyltransferase domain-containing protein n=1 Tax=Yoonia sp. TaxID=2212373 RepID=UPI001A03CCED|nr:methyltransferase domain-containing protein [Yoonia sp.]MBE0414094.1 methyltransferase domain-containing protein [Yoonia sp.]